MKKILSLLLAFAVAIVIPSGFAPNAASAAPNGTAISTVEELKAMENNPSGSYYLANDIDVTSNLKLFTNRDKPFKGTFDGNGHKIKGYKYTSSKYEEYVALFVFAEGATFKNLSISVDINLTGGGCASGLVSTSYGCKFYNIKTSGTIKLKNKIDLVDGYGEDDQCDAAGILNTELKKGVIKNCTNGINMEITHKGQNAPKAAGIVMFAYKSPISNCTNKGKITITHTPDKDWGSSSCEAAGIVNSYYAATAISGCKNTANISITATKATEAYSFTPVAAGVVGTSDAGVVSCSNTGNISIKNNAKGNRGAVAGGVVGEAYHINTQILKCKNSGSVSYTGVSAGGAGAITIGGVASGGTKFAQSYNKGKVSINSKVKANAGGITGYCPDMRNCYNTGAVVHKGTGFAGGLAAEASVIGGYVKANYSTGKVSGNSSKKLFKGQLIGYYDGGYDVMKRNIFNNYYKTSGKPYGAASFTWKPWLATAKKVSSISSSNCSALSSKYWKYSSKYKRLILKNNKE